MAWLFLPENEQVQYLQKIALRAENPYYEFENYYYEINAIFFGIFQIIEKYLYGIFFFGQIISLENILFRIFAQK